MEKPKEEAILNGDVDLEPESPKEVEEVV